MVDEVGNQFGKIGRTGQQCRSYDGIGLEKVVLQNFGIAHHNAGHYYSMAHFSLPFSKKSKRKYCEHQFEDGPDGSGQYVGYACKGGYPCLLPGVAVELLPYQIRVNAIVPAEV